MAEQRFRCRGVWRFASVLALLLWLCAAAFLVFTSATGSAYVSLPSYLALFVMVALFATLVFYYQQRAIVVDNEGVVVMGALSFKAFRWDEIVKIDAEAGLLPGFVAYTKRGTFAFSSLEFAKAHDLYHLCQKNLGRRVTLPGAQTPKTTASQAPSRRRTRQRRERRRQR